VHFDPGWPGSPFSPGFAGGRFGPGTATFSSPVSPDLISIILPSVRPSSTSRVCRWPSGPTTSTLPLPCLPATASTGSTSTFVACSVTTSRVAAAPLIILTSAGAVQTRRSPVASEFWPSPPGTTGTRAPPGSGPADVDAGGGSAGSVPAGSAAIVPSIAHGNGPGPFLIWARTVPTAPAILY